MNRRELLAGTTVSLAGAWPVLAADNRWETTPGAQGAVKRGLQWLAKTQGVAGNWGSNDLGLVSLGALAFLTAGHAPKRSQQYGANAARALNFVLSNAKPSGLLNISDPRRDMYNHGLSVFVLTQAYGVHHDRRLGPALDKGLKLISRVQCGDGGWEYTAARRPRGHDLSLTVMQAKALRAAMDMGLEVPPEVISRAIAYVRRCFRDSGEGGGTFTYRGDPVRPGAGAIGMAACGAVCLQEFGEYEDYRIKQSLDFASRRIREYMKVQKGQLPLGAYAMYYVSQGLYQVGGNHWRQIYPLVRDAIVKSQAGEGYWRGGDRVIGQPGQLFGTAVGVFSLSVPNRFLPILQRGHVDISLGGRE